MLQAIKDAEDRLRFLKIETEQSAARKEAAVNAMQKAELELKAFNEVATQLINTAADNHIKQVIQTAVLEGLKLSKNSTLFQPLIRLEYGEFSKISRTEVMVAGEGALRLLSRFIDRNTEPLASSIDNTIALLRAEIVKEEKPSNSTNSKSIHQALPPTAGITEPTTTMVRTTSTARPISENVQREEGRGAAAANLTTTVPEFKEGKIHFVDLMNQKYSASRDSRLLEAGAVSVTKDKNTNTDAPSNTSKDAAIDDTDNVSNPAI
jgi:hypothetical protein